jgi:acyl-CoA reductase-like NAD-dependent aldehyde dehydrogenase
VARVAEIVSTLKPAQNFGPIITPAQFEKVQEYWEIAEEEGAKRVVGGTSATDGDLAEGHYVLPTIYTNVEPRMRIAQEEVFGPVLAVTPVRRYRQLSQVLLRRSSRRPKMGLERCRPGENGGLALRGSGYSSEWLVRAVSPARQG